MGGADSTVSRSLADLDHWLGHPCFLLQSPTLARALMPCTAYSEKKEGNFQAKSAGMICLVMSAGLV